MPDTMTDQTPPVTEREGHPAQTVSRYSQLYVHTHNKQAWLDMFAEEGVIEDPIGPSYLDPEGKGHRTAAEREAFWDNNIANSDIHITIHQSYSVGLECANHVTLVMQFEHEGARLQQEINGVFTYAVNSEGKLTALRGYWELETAMGTITPVGSK